MSIETDRAWMAGIVDGEGTIAFERHSITRYSYNHYYPTVQLVNTNVNTFPLFMEEYGGYMSMVSDKRAIATRHKQAYRWLCDMDRMEQFLTDIRPYLRLKSEQCGILLDYIANAKRLHRFNLHGSKCRTPIPDEIVNLRYETYIKLHVLNKRGTENEAGS